jgi:polysaccharide pyruvyl transferase WcaK-like protein
MKYNIIGWYSRANCGDEAFKLAFPKLLGTNDIKFSEYEDPDCINILGGGDVIKPFYLDRIKGPFYIIGTGLGYESELQLLRGKQVLKAFFRNKRDAFLARMYNIDAEYAPDIVFALNHVEKKLAAKKHATVILNGAILPSLATTDHATIAYAEYLKWTLSKALDDLAQYYELSFIPFSNDRFNRDAAIHYDIYGRMKATASALHKPPSPEETMRIIANSDLVVTMKFHGVVFSVLNGTPFVNIGLSRKSHQFCVEERLEKLSIDPYSFTYQKFMDAVKAAESTDSALLLAIAEEKRNILLGSKFI